MKLSKLDKIKFENKICIHCDSNFQTKYSEYCEYCEKQMFSYCPTCESNLLDFDCDREHFCRGCGDIFTTKELIEYFAEVIFDNSRIELTEKEMFYHFKDVVSTNTHGVFSIPYEKITKISYSGISGNLEIDVKDAPLTHINWLDSEKMWEINF